MFSTRRQGLTPDKEAFEKHIAKLGGKLDVYNKILSKQKYLLGDVWQFPSRKFLLSTFIISLYYILPFAGIPENGWEIDGLDDKSELAHCMMLVNLLQILGAVKNKKASHHFVTRPTQVILSLSPNHSLFGNDGLYSESKISFETLLQQWALENWGEYLCLAGAVIG